MFRLRLNYLHCAKSQEGASVGGVCVGDDEIRLTINEMVVLRSGNMSDGQTTTGFLIPELEFSGAPELTLIEEDMPELSNDDELLGIWTIAKQVGEFAATFALNDAIYLHWIHGGLGGDAGRRVALLRRAAERDARPRHPRNNRPRGATLR